MLIIGIFIYVSVNLIVSLMNSLFITGSDTDVGKTYVTAGLATLLKSLGKDVGVMKPFSAGIPNKKYFQTNDVKIISNAANVSDSIDLINPQFFPIPASPFTAWKNLKNKPRISLVLKNYKKLCSIHEFVLVEGIGGIMTPILKNYFVTDLIKSMNSSAVIVCSNKIGSINHTLMTINMCHKYKIPLNGIIINNFHKDGYDSKELHRDLSQLTEVPIIGNLPHIKKLDSSVLFEIFKKSINSKFLKSILNS